MEITTEAEQNAWITATCQRSFTSSPIALYQFAKLLDFGVAHKHVRDGIKVDFFRDWLSTTACNDLHFEATLFYSVVTKY